MKNNKNNKGFTMVELIIVIAILAILMVALVPQFIAYVERAKESNDTQIAKNLEEAIEIAVIDPKNDFDGGAITITWTGSTGTLAITSSTSDAADADALAIFNDAAEVMGATTTGAATYTLTDLIASSTDGKTEIFTVSIAATSGEVTTTWDVDFWD